MEAKLSLQSKAPLKGVSFDLWQTIIAINKEFSQQRNRLFYEALDCAAHGISEETFASTFRHMKNATERQSEHTSRHVPYSARMAQLCHDLHLSQPSNEQLGRWQARQSELLRAHPATLMSAEIPKLFADIVASGRTIAIISNVGMVTAADCRHLLDIYSLQVYIRYELFSDETGLAKPNHLIFEHLTDQMGCKPAEILHFGDSEFADYEGAREAGMSALLGTLDEPGIRILRAAIHL